MEQHEAIALIGAAVTEAGGTWADLGAGAGTFTRALASLLGPAGVVYAVDRDANALRALARASARDPASAVIRTVVGDFTEPVELPTLDGVVLANALHFVPYAEQPHVLQRIVPLLVERAPLVIVEYERRVANRYVPFPITFDALGTLARECALDAPRLLATRPSRYQGTIYSAVLRRPPSS
jgi:ubiquinone/menaquinone biosynthesis C-methylase UbiE